MKKRVKQKNFPVNQLCFWEDNGECQGYNITSIRDEDGVYKVKYTVKFVDDSESTSDVLAKSIIETITGCPHGAGGGKRKRKSKKNNIGIN